MEILYIDDDVDDIEFFEEALRNIDPSIQFKYAKGCGEAFINLTDSPVKPDAIFIDLHLPKVEGLECIKMIKESDDLKHISIIVLSGTISSKQVDDFNKLGVYYFLSKSALLSDITPALKVIIDSLCKNENKMHQPSSNQDPSLN